MGEISRKVFIYALNWLPFRNGEGTQIGLFSDIRAYQDCGFQVEYHCFFQKDFKFDKTLLLNTENLNIHMISVDNMYQNQSVLDRISYWLGWPDRQLIQYIFPWIEQIKQIVEENERNFPDSIHQFSYLNTASVILLLGKINTIYRMHDLEHKFREGHFYIREKVENRSPSIAENKLLLDLRRIGKAVVQKSKITTCYGIDEAVWVKTNWKKFGIEYLPISWADEKAVERTRAWCDGNKLQMLHIGRIDALPNFSSIKFLLTDVFQNIPEDTMKKIELVIVGKITATSRSNYLIKLAQNFSNVRFVDYQENLKEWYSRSDLQIVGSQVATGLRTRIIESMAFGLPVLSTITGASGLIGVDNDRSVLLAKNTNDFCDWIVFLANNPSYLELQSQKMKDCYLQYYERSIIAGNLNSIIKQYI